MNIILTNVIIVIFLSSASSVNYSDDVLNERLMISLERPRVITENPQFIHVVNMTSRRTGRSDPNHYVHMCVTLFSPYNNSFIVNINVKDSTMAMYSITYLQLQYKFCDFLKMLKYDVYYKQNITETLAPTVIKYNNNNCVLVPGTYYFTNALLPKVNFPSNFPLQNSRLYFNVTYKYKALALRTHIDLELKPIPRRGRKN